MCKCILEKKCLIGLCLKIYLNKKLYNILQHVYILDYCYKVYYNIIIHTKIWNELIEMQTDLIWPIEVHNGTLFSFHNISSVYKWTQLNCLSCITKSVIFTDCRWQDTHFFFQTILLCSLISRAAVPQSWNWNCNDQGWHYLWSWGWIDIVKLSVVKKTASISSPIIRKWGQ